MFGEFHLLAQKIPLVAVLMNTSLLRVVVGGPLQGKFFRLYLVSTRCPNVKQNIVHMPRLFIVYWLLICSHHEYSWYTVHLTLEVNLFCCLFFFDRYTVSDCPFGIFKLFVQFLLMRSRHGRDRVVVGFTTTCPTSPYHHWSCDFVERCTRYNIMW